MTLPATPAETPPRLARALTALRAWGERGVHFAPIRHHSPACALALQALLAEVRPGVVLVEGPREYAGVLAALAHPDTAPPVAVLSIDGPRAAFYPLAEFSPEWVALRWGAAAGASVEFIDQSYAAQADDADAGVVTLQAEHHLARSAAIAALAARLGCRDHDEVWEHLFEVRSDADLAEWRGFFADALAWAALARLEADRAVLDADGTHDREAVMAAALTRHADGGRPVVVVTGAFHTLALLEVLERADEGEWVTSRPLRAVGDQQSWLIRYDFDRLDGLRGYGAGMPSPAFWQRVWRARTGGVGPREFVASVMVAVADRLRAEGEPLGTAGVLAASEQALRLAELRGRAWPGRTDVLDGLTSCLAKDDTGLSGALGQAVRAVFTSGALGSVPEGVASPPLVAEARNEASGLRFDVTSAETRRASLDTARKPRHRVRREFLARMRFVGSGFARQVGGADLVAGRGLGQFAEEWEYAWTPAVEAALIDASATGPTIDALISVRVAEALAADDATPAQHAHLIAELLVMGLPERLPPVCGAFEAALADAPRLEDVVASLHELVGLVEGVGRLSFGDQAARVSGLVARGLAVVAYLVPGLAGLGADDCEPAADGLLSLRDLLRRLGPEADAAAVHEALAWLRADPGTPPRLRGVLVGLASTDGALDRAATAAIVTAHVATGTDPEQIAEFLVGLMQAAPDVLVYGPDLVETLSESLLALEEEEFLAILPELRRAFTFLKPTETHRLAELVARLTGASASEIDVVLRVDPQAAAAARQVERDLVAGLVRDGLGEWVAS